MASRTNGADRRTKRQHAIEYPMSRRSGHAAASAYEALRQQILDGTLSPGAHLSQKVLAGTLGISNGPIINALRRLAHEGLVTHERGQGCRVSEWSAEKLDDLLTLRRALETEAARLAARRAGPEDIERLRQIVDRMEELVRQDRHVDADRVDVELHVAIAKLSRTSTLIEALARCHLLEVVRRRLRANERFGDFENLAANHRILVDAIATGDPDRAGEAMRVHLTPTRSNGQHDKNDAISRH